MRISDWSSDVCSSDLLCRALARIHVDRGLALEVAGDAGAAFRGERQDLEEMLGNLVDNACKWAHSRVRVSAAVQGARLRLTIEDDGKGLAEAEDRKSTRLNSSH